MRAHPGGGASGAGPGGGPATTDPPGPTPNTPARQGLAWRIAHAVIDSKRTPLIVVASVLLGAFAVLMLPREEEPQIRVPMMDVMVAMPGASAGEVEERATRPMEKLLWEVLGVEYPYSLSREGEARRLSLDHISHCPIKERYIY